MNFSEYLSHKNIESGLYSVLTDIVFCIKEISDLIAKGNEGYGGGENVYGEKQIKMDVLANQILVSRLNDNADVSFIASEELESPYEAEVPGGGYSVCFDPLDGSSLVDVNLAVGTIVGVYKGQGVLGRKGREQVASLIAVYGPRLSFMITLGARVDEFIFDRDKDTFVLFNENLKIAERGKIFAPGNLNACKTDNWYRDFLNYWINNDYKLRYSGGMVPDVNQIMKKGGGIFVYPGSLNKPEGKLRLIYECAPVAMLVEAAGGVAMNGKERILDLEINSLQQTTPVFLGSKKEVQKAEQYLNG